MALTEVECSAKYSHTDLADGQRIGAKGADGRHRFDQSTLGTISLNALECVPDDVKEP